MCLQQSAATLEHYNLVREIEKIPQVHTGVHTCFFHELHSDENLAASFIKAD